MGMIIEGLTESRVDEAAQSIHVVRYTSNGLKDAQVVCSAREYNKIKKLPGYKELDHTEISKDDIKLHCNYIRDAIDKYGLKEDNFSPDRDGDVLGHYGQLGYGYQLFKTSKLKPTGYGFNK